MRYVLVQSLLKRLGLGLSVLMFFVPSMLMVLVQKSHYVTKCPKLLL